MAMCSSGSLGIISCPQGGCSSIALAVCGSVASPPYSLCALSIAAGKTAPHSMLEFYGYGPIPKTVNLNSLICSGNGTVGAKATSCLCTSLAMSAGEYYYANFNWWLNNDTDYGIAALWCFMRNGVCVCGCSSIPGDYCNGSASICIASGDTTCLITCGKVTTRSTGTANESYVELSSITGCANYSIGTGICVQRSITCGGSIV